MLRDEVCWKNPDFGDDIERAPHRQASSNLATVISIRAVGSKPPFTALAADDACPNCFLSATHAVASCISAAVGFNARQSEVARFLTSAILILSSPHHLNYIHRVRFTFLGICDQRGINPLKRPKSGPLFAESLLAKVRPRCYARLLTCQRDKGKADLRAISARQQAFVALILQGLLLIMCPLR